MFFNGVGELHTCVRKKLDAVVLIGIVGGGDDNAHVKIVVADEAGNAGRSQNPGEGNGSPALREPGSCYRSNMRTGFSSVGANKSVRRGVVAVKVFRNGAAEGKKRGVVEGRNSRDAADAVCSKKLSRHRFEEPSGQTDKKFSTATTESRESAEANVLTCSARRMVYGERN